MRSTEQDLQRQLCTRKLLGDASEKFIRGLGTIEKLKAASEAYTPSFIGNNRREKFVDLGIQADARVVNLYLRVAEDASAMRFAEQVISLESDNAIDGAPVKDK